MLAMKHVWLVWFWSVFAVLLGIHVTTSISPVQAAGTTYYVSPSGLDTNPGTQTSPWKTIQKAANSVIAGDTVNVADGIQETTRVTINKSGTEQAPIIFEASGGVDAATTKGFTLGSTSPISYVTLKGFRVINAIGKGIEIMGKNCIIENNYVEFSSDGGILIKLLASMVNGTVVVDYTSSSQCIIKNNRIYHNAQFGIEVHGRNHLIEGNEIWRTIQHHPNRVPSPAWADADGMHFHGSGHIFKNNYIHDIPFDEVEVIDSHTDCFQTFESLPYKERASNITLENNRCLLPYHCHSNTCKANPGQAVTKGWMLQQASNLTIKNNLIYTYYGIKSDRPAADPRFTIINNTFIGLADQSELQCTVGSNCWPTGVSLDSATNSVIKNNIFYNQLYKVMELKNSTAGIQADYNLAYRSDGTTPPGRPPAPFGQHDLWGVDPKFVNPGGGDYRLQSGSPACTGGENGTYTGTFSCGSGASPSPTPSPSPAKPGDLNIDGKVDIFDYNIIIFDFDKTGSAGFIPADINKNGKVDIFDYNVVVENFGK